MSGRAVSAGCSGSRPGTSGLRKEPSGCCWALRPGEAFADRGLDFVADGFVPRIAQRRRFGGAQDRGEQGEAREGEECGFHFESEGLASGVGSSLMVISTGVSTGGTALAFTSQTRSSSLPLRGLLIKAAG